MNKVKIIIYFLFCLILTGCTNNDEKIRTNFYNELQTVQFANSNQVTNEIYIEFPKEKKALTYLVEDISGKDEKYSFFLKSIITQDENSNYNINILIKKQPEEEYYNLLNIIYINSTEKIYLSLNDLKNIFNLITKDDFNFIVNKKNITNESEENEEIYNTIKKLIETLPTGYIELDYNSEIKLNETKEIYKLINSYLTSCFKVIESQYKNTLINYDKKKDLYKIVLNKSEIEQIIGNFQILNKDNYNSLLENIKKVKDIDLTKLEELSNKIYNFDTNKISENVQLEYSLKSVFQKENNIYNYGQNITYKDEKSLISLNILKTNLTENMNIESPKNILKLENIIANLLKTKDINNSIKEDFKQNKKPENIDIEKIELNETLNNILQKIPNKPLNEFSEINNFEISYKEIYPSKFNSKLSSEWIISDSNNIVYEIPIKISENNDDSSLIYDKFIYSIPENFIPIDTNTISDIFYNKESDEVISICYLNYNEPNISFYDSDLQDIYNNLIIENFGNTNPQLKVIDCNSFFNFYYENYDNTGYNIDINISIKNGDFIFITSISKANPIENIKNTLSDIRFNFCE